MPTITGAILLIAVALAIAIYLSQPALPVNIIIILQIGGVIFFGLVLLRQLILRPKRETFTPGTDGQKPASLPGLALALVASAAAYAPTLSLFFACDDFDHISGLHMPFLTSVWPQFTHGQFDGKTYIFYRPLGFASFFLDYRLWHTWAPGYHVTNLLLHLLSVMALFFFCREIGLNREICTTTALLFGILPVNAQSVTWIACRFDQLATTFQLGSLLFAAQFRRTRRPVAYVAAAGFFLLAALSKESSYVLPVLLIALELLPLEESRHAPLLSPRRLLPLLGYVGIAGVAFLHRSFVIGGIGGYHEPSGGSVVGHFGPQSLIGVLVRGPSIMLFGNNTFQPPSLLLIVLILMPAVLLLALALLAPGVSSCKPIFCFALLWIFVSILPAHFYFVTPYFGFPFARVLYFGSAGLALLLALLLHSAFQNLQLRRAWVFVLCLLLVAGLEENIAAWRWVSDSTRNFLAQLKTIEPTPPPGTTFFIANVPAAVRATPFFVVGLQNAVRLAYGNRTDITAHRLTADTPASLALQPDVVFVEWRDPNTLESVILGDTANPIAVRLR